jgi:hypothetical protein
MTFLRKIIMLSGLLFLFCLAQSENKSQSVSIVETQKDSNLRQQFVSSSCFIQPPTVHFTEISNRFHSPSFALFTALFFTLKLATNEEVVAKAFSSKSINRVPTVSFLLFPVHYFW